MGRTVARRQYLKKGYKIGIKHILSYPSLFFKFLD
jgi:hypothetical protein